MDRKGPGAVFRDIPSKILTAEPLGLSPYLLQLCHLNEGLILVTGPTGSGESTTLCALISKAVDKPGFEALLKRSGPEARPKGALV
jgi:Tfp pilus assembly pilus retraction ATPase PilT